MKKAKDYARQFEQNPSTETLREIAESFMQEINEIAQMRHAKGNDAYFAILDEQDRKWRAFARCIDGIKEDGFERLVEKVHPEVHAVWRPMPKQPRQFDELSPAGKALVSLAVLGSMWRDKST